MGLRLVTPKLKRENIMKTINLVQAQKIMASGKFFTILGYAKKDGSLRNFNCRQGVKVHSNGGAWNGNSAKNLLIAEPISQKTKAAALASNMKVNAYRTLILDSLLGCELRAHGEVYKIN